MTAAGMGSMALSSSMEPIDEMDGGRLWAWNVGSILMMGSEILRVLELVSSMERVSDMSLVMGSTKRFGSQGLRFGRT